MHTVTGYETPTPPDPDHYVITFLEMGERPAPPVHAPIGPHIALIRAEELPVHYFKYLYGTVGEAYEWTDWFAATLEEQEAFVSDPQVELFTLMLDGVPGGFFMLDMREAGICDLACFGLMPQAIGRGLGRWFLQTAVQAGWDRPGIHRLTVNTCTLDHAQALPLYQKVGFKPVRRETKKRRAPETG